MKNYQKIKGQITMRSTPILRHFYGILAALFISMLAINAAFAIDIQEVESKSGIKAFLVEDHAVPLVAMSFKFKGGTSQDETGREGTATLMSATLDEGAGDILSQDFLAKLDELGIELSFSAGLDEFGGNFQTLAENQDEAFKLLQLAVNDPRFDEDAVERLKSQFLVGLKNREKKAGEISQKIWREKFMGDHPYGKAGDGTLETMAKLTGDDLRKFHKRIFAKDNLYIGVVGAITADELKIKLDEVFGNLPEKADLNPIPEKILDAKGTFTAELEVPQSSISMWLPGIKRDDPEFFAAYIVNHILGGGTFSSRLYEEVREKRGLTYGISSYLGTYDHMGLIGFNLATSSKNTNEAIKIIQEEIKRMSEDGPTQEELDSAKKFLSGAYAINNLDTSAKIASVLVALQSQNLGKDYIENRQNLIKDVTLEKTKEVAKKLLSDEPAIIIVGPKSALKK